MIARLLAGSLAAALAFTSGAPDALAQTTAFVDVNVLPMDRDTVYARQTVIVSDGRITAIGPASSTAVPAGARRVDGAGRSYLMPGLIDAHVHLELGERRWLPLFLAHGVTTVFNLRGEARHLALRAAIDSGVVVGPSVFTAGAYVNLPMIANEDDARRAVAEQSAAGYDFLKIHGNLTGPAFRTLADDARKAKLALIGHAPRNLPFDSVLANRMPMVAHVEEILYTHFKTSADTSGVGTLAARMREAGVWLTPNLSAYALIARQIGDTAVIDSFVAAAPPAFLDSALMQVWRSGMYTKRPASTAPNYARSAAFLSQITGALHRGGVRMLAGTDTPLPGLAPGASLLLDLRLLREAGLSPFDALATATSNAGQFIAESVRPGLRVGVVAVGARADLVLLSANPLAEPSVLMKPSGVMARGVWYDRARLDGFIGAPTRDR